MQQAMKHRKMLEPVWNDLDTFDIILLVHIRAAVAPIVHILIAHRSLVCWYAIF